MIFLIRQDHFEKMRKQTGDFESFVAELASGNTKEELVRLLDSGYRKVIKSTLSIIEHFVEKIQKGEYVPVPPLAADELTSLAERMANIAALGRRVFDLPREIEPMVN